MEEAVYNELREICRKIIDSGPDAVPSEYLKRVREVEEKLILLDYLHYRKQSLQQKTSPQTTSLDEELLDTLKKAEDQLSESPAARPALSEEPPQEELFTEPEDIVPAKEQVPEIHEEPATPKRSINESFAGGQIKLGLNDRLAFTKHLFSGSQEDLNRVVSQLNTFTTYQEAISFIEEMVKPDYDWDAETEYEERLVHLVKARFGEE